MVKRFGLKGFDSVFFASHLLFLIFSYSIYLAPYIAPSTFPYFGFVPIIYPLIVIANAVVLLILFLRRKDYFVLLLILSLGLIPPLAKTYRPFGKKSEVQPNFKLITFNGHYLREPGFEEFFKNEKPDVVLFQEVYWRDPKFQKLKEGVFSDYFHEKNTLNQIFSKYPIIEFQPIYPDLPGTTAYASYADIDTGHDTLRIINLYLEPMRIDKKLIKESVNSEEEAKANSKVLTNKLTIGFLRHQDQIKELMPYIQNSPYPIILAGDLNSVPNSYEYQQIKYWLNDAFTEVGKGSGTSFHDFKYPLRLDFVFHSDEIIPVSYQVLSDVKLSDHYPVVAEFKLPNPAGK